MKDRAMQALYAVAFNPVAETLADPTPIKRHVKISGDADPFLREYAEYFETRKANAKLKPRGTLLHIPKLPEDARFQREVKSL